MHNFAHANVELLTACSYACIYVLCQIWDRKFSVNLRDALSSLNAINVLLHYEEWFPLCL